MNVKEYLISQAVLNFNGQFGTNWDTSTDTWGIKLITANNNSKFGVVIYTQISGDTLRLRVYYTIARGSEIGKFVYQDVANMGPGLGDELFVADGIVDETFLNLNNNEVRRLFMQWVEPIDSLNILLGEDGTPIVAGDDTDYLFLELPVNYPT